MAKVFASRRLAFVNSLVIMVRIDMIVYCYVGDVAQVSNLGYCLTGSVHPVKSKRMALYPVGKTQIELLDRERDEKVEK
jgi:hypothetical protein